MTTDRIELNKIHIQSILPSVYFTIFSFKKSIMEILNSKILNKRSLIIHDYKHWVENYLICYSYIA